MLLTCDINDSSFPLFPGQNHPGLAKRGIKGDFIKSTMLDYNENLKSYSQMLRKDMTKAETRLWTRLRGKQLNQIQFYRQKIIGNYIVDFYCPKTSLVIELDGGQHYTICNPKACMLCAIRTGMCLKTWKA